MLPGPSIGNGMGITPVRLKHRQPLLQSLLLVVSAFISAQPIVKATAFILTLPSSLSLIIIPSQKSTAQEFVLLPLGHRQGSSRGICSHDHSFPSQSGGRACL